MQHRIKGAALVVQDNRLLLTKSRDHITGEEFWVPPGGGVEGDEDRFIPRSVLGLAIVGLYLSAVAACAVAPTATPTPTATVAPTAIPTSTAIPTPTATPKPEPAVRVVYAIPTDREHQESYAAAVNEAVLDVQNWYAEQLGGQTFTIGGAIPLVCMLKSPASYYEGWGGWTRMVEGLQHCAPVTYPSHRTVWVVYPDVAFDCDNSELGRGGYGVTILHRGDLDGLVNPSTYDHCGYGTRGEHGWIGGLAHELGHAFGLPHPPGCDERLDACDEDALMWWGYSHDYPDTYLTEADVATLQTSPFFSFPR